MGAKTAMAGVNSAEKREPGGRWRYGDSEEWQEDSERERDEGGGRRVGGGRSKWGCGGSSQTQCGRVQLMAPNEVSQLRRRSPRWQERGPTLTNEEVNTFRHTHTHTHTLIQWLLVMFHLWRLATQCLWSNLVCLGRQSVSGETECICVKWWALSWSESHFYLSILPLRSINISNAVKKIKIKALFFLF